MLLRGGFKLIRNYGGEEDEYKGLFLGDCI